MEAGLPRVWRRLIRDSMGGTAIEFSILAPVILFVLLMMVEFGFILAGEILLGAGARSAARFARTGQVIEGETRVESIRRIVTEFVCPKAASSPDGEYCLWNAQAVQQSDDGILSPLQVRMRTYSDPRSIGMAESYSDISPANGSYDLGEPFTDANGNGQWDSDMARSGAGGAGEFVIYDLEMGQKIMNPLFRHIGENWLVVHRVSISVQNENF